MGKSHIKIGRMRPGPNFFPTCFKILRKPSMANSWVELKQSPQLYWLYSLRQLSLSNPICALLWSQILNFISSLQDSNFKTSFLEVGRWKGYHNSIRIYCWKLFCAKINRRKVKHLAQNSTADFQDPSFSLFPRLQIYHQKIYLGVYKKKKIFPFPGLRLNPLHSLVTPDF